MKNFSPFTLTLILQCLLFIVPINIYVIGDWLGAGIQWGLFRYVQSYIGSSLIFFTKYITYISEGTLIGRSALAAGLDIIAAVCLILAFCIVLWGYLTGSIIYVRAAAVVTLVAGCIFLIADMLLYGIFFHGLAGSAIPVGVPVIIACGWWMYRIDFRNSTSKGSENKDSKTGDLSERM